MNAHKVKTKNYRKKKSEWMTLSDCSSNKIKNIQLLNDFKVH